MKKCTYCGKEQPDEAEVCSYDSEPLVRIGGATPPPIPQIPKRPPQIVPAPQQIKSPAKPLSGIVIAAIVMACIVAVIGPIGIMAGLLLPALAKAKEKAMRIHCASNLKQVGLAERMWSSDHNDAMPKSLTDLTNEMLSPMALHCMADEKHPVSTQDTPILLAISNTSYDFFFPIHGQTSNDVIARCPIHGTELLGDGSIRMGKLNPNR